MNAKLLFLLAGLALLAGCSTCRPPGRLDWTPYHNEWREKQPKYPVPNVTPGTDSSKHFQVPRF